MVQDSQKEILENWDNSEKTQKKKRIRNRLGTDFVEVRHLLKMSPDEAQDAVQNAIARYTEEEFPDISDEREIEKELARQLFSVLFNGFSEEAFNYGFNAGVGYTLEWWASSGDLHASWLKDNLHSSKNINILEGDYGPIKKKFDSPPNNERERRKRILILENKPSVAYSSEFEEFSEVDIDSIKKDHGYVPVADLKRTPSRDDIRPAQEFLHAIEIGRRRGLKFCFKINNPNNLGGKLKCDWFVRETIELHRDYLEKEGHLPNEEDLPKYGHPERTVRNPAKLNLKEWDLTSIN